MIRRRPLTPSRSEVFGFNRLHVGFQGRFHVLVLGEDGEVRVEEFCGEE